MPANDIAIVGWGQTPLVSKAELSEPQLCVNAVLQAIQTAGVNQRDIGFTCSGSCDYLSGGPFVFVANLEAAGAWPPIAESHVEMDGAWALYEAWVRLQEGDIDTALVFSSGKSSPSDPAQLFPQQLDPYYLAPLGLDPNSMAALQARALLDSGKATERDFAEIAGRVHQQDPDTLLKADYVCAPLRAHDIPPITDGAAAVVLATAAKARDLTDHPVYIRGIDHRIEAHQIGMRDLTSSRSTKLAAEKAQIAKATKPDLAELSALYSPQEIILKEALGLDDSVTINPSGGPLAANPVMATGLIRIIEAAQRIAGGEAQRALAHATNGQCLQHNLVCLREGE
jgi:acetyl-CoA acetyltransferase